MRVGSVGSRAPRVSVIVSTFNWSAVLGHAIASVLSQTFRDFELLVVGDCCTDDSAAVVRSFGDRRISWHNLERNSGNQSGPNNRGLELARGEFVAYLGHDDVWHPEHLAVLVAGIERSGADLVYAVTQVLGAPGSGDRRLFGLTPGGGYVPRLFAPPSSVLHRTDMAREIGGWRDYRTIRLPPDFEFLHRAWEHGKKIVGVNELTVFKFPSSLRPGAYVEKKSDEQAECVRRLADDPDFRYRELMATLNSLAATHRQLMSVTWIPDDIAPGSIVEALRSVRGLPPVESLEPTAAAAPRALFADRAALLLLNRRDDIGPLRCRQTLHGEDGLPEDGLFLGRGWHDLERDEWGLPLRWAGGPAELVVTRPSGTRQRLRLEAFPGPGAGAGPLALSIRDGDGAEEARVELRARREIEIDVRLAAGAGTTLKLVPEGGGRMISTDPRRLDFALAAFDWA